MAVRFLGWLFLAVTPKMHRLTHTPMAREGLCVGCGDARARGLRAIRRALSKREASKLKRGRLFPAVALFLIYCAGGCLVCDIH